MVMESRQRIGSGAENFPVYKPSDQPGGSLSSQFKNERNRKMSGMTEEEQVMLSKEPGLNEFDLGAGLTDGEAVQIIMNDLRTLLQQKEDHFTDQKSKRRQ